MDDELKPFRDAASDLEGWRLRQIRNPPEQPLPGSDLAEDDKAFPMSLISEAVRISLISAGEHLRLALDGLNSGNLYGTAQYSAVRGAVIGAAQSVWVLAPEDRTERQKRGYTVIADSYRQLRKFHQRHLDFAALLGLTPEERAQVQDQIDWIGTRQETLRQLGFVAPGVNLTDALKLAAQHIFPNDSVRQADLNLSWNALSADAHVLSWSLTTRADFSSSTGPDRLTGLSTGVVAGEALPYLARYFDLAVRSLRCGWNLFDRRCEEP